MPDREDCIPSVSRALIHRGAKFDFVSLSYPSPAGATITRECVRHPGAVVILPVHHDGRVVFVRNFRASIPARLLELPAGTREPGEPPEETARRELEEETGLRAATMSLLGRFYTSPGLSDELMWAFLARGLREGPSRPEPDEDLIPVTLAPAALEQALASGEIIDGKTLATLLLARRHAD